jgi:hypothetical protein
MKKSEAFTHETLQIANIITPETPRLSSQTKLPCTDIMAFGSLGKAPPF